MPIFGSLYDGCLPFAQLQVLFRRFTYQVSSSNAAPPWAIRLHTVNADN